MLPLVSFVAELWTFCSPTEPLFGTFQSHLCVLEAKVATPKSWRALFRAPGVGRVRFL